MSGNTESTANSIKFAPMPMSALLANLMPLQKSTDSADSSFMSDDESDDSIIETVAKKPSPRKVNIDLWTPNTRVTQYKDTKGYASERKIVSKQHDKENLNDDASNLTYPNKDGNIFHSAHKILNSIKPCSEVKARGILMPHTNNNRILQSRINSVHKKTPETKIATSSQKKTATPKIKQGIRRFTPGSNTKLSHKKTPQKPLIQNRDRVRCELFSQKQKDELYCPPPWSEPAPVSTPAPAPPPVALAASLPLAAPPLMPVPETPINKKSIPLPYVATPSFPQGLDGNKPFFKSTIIKDKKYMCIKKIGIGGSSEVYKVLDPVTFCEYAVKTVNLASDKELAQNYVNEVRLLRSLQNSDRVIKLHDYEYDRVNQILRMVMEVGETDLSSFLKARGAGLPPALVLHYWEEMLHAVNYIHEHGVIHADLKPGNFLLVCGQLKLIDFGIASTISSDATSVVRAQATGTYSYISPEALMGGAGGYGASAGDGSAPIKISFRSDVWSLGCILYSMVYGRTPFSHIPNLAKLAAILDPNHRIDYPPVEHLPSSLISTLKRCLTYNARERPTVPELLAEVLVPRGRPLPRVLLDKLQAHVTPHEFRLLQRAQL